MDCISYCFTNNYLSAIDDWLSFESSIDIVENDPSLEEKSEEVVNHSLFAMIEEEDSTKEELICPNYTLTGIIKNDPHEEHLTHYSLMAYNDEVQSNYTSCDDIATNDD